jgi:hypothetical protein
MYVAIGTWLEIIQAYVRWVARDNIRSQEEGSTQGISLRAFPIVQILNEISL